MIPEPVIAIDAVSRLYRGRAALDRVSLTLDPGRILALLGASGSGKSTLLRLIAGLEPVDAGTIAMDGRIVSTPGRTLAPERRRVGMVFQDFALFPHMTVARNIAFGMRHLPRVDRADRVAALLARIRLSDRAGAYPHALSGGEQQRVALARVMARDPAVVLLDEPFSSLDGPLRAELRDEVVAMLRGAGASAIVVTHDAEDAMAMADDLVLMARGRVVQAGRPADCHDRPLSLEAARLLGPMTAVRAEVEGGTARSVLGIVQADGLDDGPATIAARPDDIAWDPVGSGAVVEGITFQGAYHHMDVRMLGGGERISLRSRGVPPAIGTAGGISVAPDVLRVFAA